MISMLTGEATKGSRGGQRWLKMLVRMSSELSDSPGVRVGVGVGARVRCRAGVRFAQGSILGLVPSFRVGSQF